MRVGNIGASIFLMVLGIFMVIESGNMIALAGMNPGVVPKVLGIGIAGLSAILLVTEFVPHLQSQGKMDWPEGRARTKVVTTAGVILLYLATLEWVGFTLGTFCFVVTIIKVLGQYKWVTNLAAGIATTAVCVTVFQILLDLKLPGGFIGI